jgi:hypothetical protein
VVQTLVVITSRNRTLTAAAVLVAVLLLGGAYLWQRGPVWPWQSHFVVSHTEVTCEPVQPDSFNFLSVHCDVHAIVKNLGAPGTAVVTFTVLGTHSYDHTQCSTATPRTDTGDVASVSCALIPVPGSHFISLPTVSSAVQN